MEALPLLSLAIFERPQVAVTNQTIPEAQIQKLRLFLQIATHYSFQNLINNAFIGVLTDSIAVVAPITFQT